MPDPLDLDSAPGTSAPSRSLLVARGKGLLPPSRPPLPEDGTLGDWEFLPQLGCQTAPNLCFWVSTLSDIKFNSTDEVKSPHRVKDLYLLLYEIYQEAMDGNEGEKKVANYIRGNLTLGSLFLQPQGWNNPDYSVRSGPEGMYSKKCSMPLPAEWSTTPSESNLIARFYKEVLLLEDVTRYRDILEKLRLYQTKYPSNGRKHVNRYKRSSIGSVPNLYQGLEDLDVCGRDREFMIQEFKNHPYIFCPPKPKWGHEWIYHNQMRDLFSLLNCLIAKSNISIKADELLSRRVFLGRYHGEKDRFVGTEDFFIPDDQEFATTFKDNLPLLDVTSEEIALLDPLCSWPPTAQKRKIEWDVAQRAEGILRCLGTGPIHCRGFMTPSTLPRPFIPSNDASHPVDRIVVYVSSDKEERDLALFKALPQRLIEWLMADPKTQKQGPATLLGVSLLKNVLTAPPSVIDVLLTSDGFGRIRTIEVNLTAMRQEATLQNTTSNEPVNQPSQSRYGSDPYSNVLFEFEAHSKRSENVPRAKPPQRHRGKRSQSSRRPQSDPAHNRDQ
ncbi:hypothetical protein F52700_9508 [Fusarium sp. NRRL 52700]|nr:hypothetical protein F52700_9508 [Fusarium sp. NRRL 52700]